MSTNVNEEDPMISGTDAAVRRTRARRTPLRRAAPPTVEEAAERFVEELLGTFTDRWEW